MPSQSERQEIIEELEEALILWEIMHLFEKDDGKDDPTYKALEAAYLFIYSQRYLLTREGIRRAPNRLDWLLNELDDGRFKQETRMSKENFFQLLALIEKHEIFHTAGRRPQRPVHHQLLVALKRFGCFGNGASVGNIARSFGLSGKTLKI